MGNRNFNNEWMAIQKLSRERTGMTLEIST